LSALSIWQKMNNIPKHHGVGAPDAPCPIKLHRLHRLKAGPEHMESMQLFATCPKQRWPE